MNMWARCGHEVIASGSCVVARRADYALGKAIRDGQENGTITKRGSHKTADCSLSTKDIASNAELFGDARDGQDNGTVATRGAYKGEARKTGVCKDTVLIFIPAPRARGTNSGSTGVTFCDTTSSSRAWEAHDVRSNFSPDPGSSRAHVGAGVILT